MITVVSAAIVDVAAKRLLLSQRSGRTSYPFCWCTPGGKVDEHETHWGALSRELHEELGIDVSTFDIAHVVYRYELPSTRTGQMVEVVCYVVSSTAIVGEYACRDGTIGVGWFDVATLERLPLAAADDANRNALTELLR